ncbi:MAG: Unknown protein [uncultured Sulfurovum sp.]|uniref:Uncharacterized protein n=1 Tax=uncultured Sulfurovum sp. TaxID=269237 RepID=A0A6S6T994_9BACT|nr:MAG: Unknown protein [uncultured Sulfurovum sp.]
MKRYFIIISSLLIVLLSFFIIKTLKERTPQYSTLSIKNIGNFDIINTCAQYPKFLTKLKIPQPIAIDLSQQQHKGLAFLYGHKLRQFLHLKTWEKFDYFSTYVFDPQGHTYLTPMPYISIKEKTFEFQKNIYKVDTHSGKLSIWMTLEEVKATSRNPYGLISLDYDCDDHTLWVSAIDETSYSLNKGVIYHIDIKSKKILNKIEGFDALSLKLVTSNTGKQLLFGGAKDNVLYALDITSLTIKKLFELPNREEKIRKIKLRNQNLLELQTIPFGYSLIAQTSQTGNRRYYQLKWNDSYSSWQLSSK